MEFGLHGGYGGGVGCAVEDDDEGAEGDGENGEGFVPVGGKVLA